MSNTQADRIPEAGHRSGAMFEEVRSKWGWFLALGIAFVIMGVIALANLVIATVASIYMVGILMLIGGAAQIVHAFGVKGWGSFFWWLLAGVVYAIAGILAFLNPLLASFAFTLVLAAALVANGILRIIVAMRARPHAGWGWVLFAGIVTALAGLVIAFGWPVNSLWILGLFLAIDLVFQGWSFVALALALRR